MATAAAEDAVATSDAVFARLAHAEGIDVLALPNARAAVRRSEAATRAPSGQVSCALRMARWF